MKRRRTYAGDRLAIQEKLGGTGRERIMASRADDSFRGEARRGEARRRDDNDHELVPSCTPRGKV